MNHHCLERAAIRVKMNILTLKQRASYAKMNFLGGAEQAPQEHEHDVRCRFHVRHAGFLSTPSHTPEHNQS